LDDLFKSGLLHIQIKKNGNGSRVKHAEEQDHLQPVDLSITGFDAGQVIRVIDTPLSGAL